MMSEAESVIAEVAAHAGERGWEVVARACETLRQAQVGGPRLVFAEGVDRVAFQAWIQGLDIGMDTSSHDLAEFQISPSAALTGGKLVAVFSANDFPSAKDMDIFNRSIAPLPHPTRCVVLVADAAKGEGADLEAINKMARGLFGADSEPVGADPALTPEGVYVWIDGLDDRVDAHVQLRSALQTPPSPVAQAQRGVMAADHVLGLVSDALRSERAAAPRTQPMETSWRAGEHEDAMRARLHQTVEDLARDLRTNIQATSAALDADVAAALSAGGARGVESARRAVENQLDQTRRNLAGVCANAGELWAGYVDRILGEVPWSMFNTPEGLDRSKLLADLAFDASVDKAIFAVAGPSSSTGFPVPATASRGYPIPGGPRPIGVLGGAVAGLGLGAKLGPMGMGVGVVVGAASGLMIAEQMEAKAGRDVRDQWREAVATWSRRAESGVSLQLDRLEQALNETLRKRLRALGDLVEGARSRSEVSASLEADLARLEAWRQRLHPAS